MKTFKLFHWMVAICLLSFCSFYSCKEEQDAPGLPPETQTGANTFGCYVNGELFVNSKSAVYWQDRPIRSTYSRSLKLLLVGADRKGGDSMGFNLFNPSEGTKMTMSDATFYPKNNNSCFCFGGKNIGEITLTKFDTIKKIVSGRFQFNGQCSDDMLNPTGDSIAKVTEGRFDIKLDIYDN